MGNKVNQLNKYPQNQIDAANLVQVEKRVGLLRTAIEEDIDYLLYHFLARESQTFDEFDSVWNELHFSYVHFACVYREYRTNIMNEFYSCLLDYFVSDMDSIKCAVIYALYFLYMSQPIIWDKVSIRVTKETWGDLHTFYIDSIGREKNIEAALIFDKLRMTQSFQFVVSETLPTPIYHERKEFEKAINMLEQIRKSKKEMIKHDALQLFMNKDISDYSMMATQYQTLKGMCLYTPAATIAAQQTLKERLHVKENKPRLLQNVLLNSTYMDDETEIISHITTAAKNLIQYRSTNTSTNTNTEQTMN
ncbi:small nuclear RNA activating complex, subunit SNAP43-domain-containing protein [Pilobolus umbonatus]|nr:small nuclear RNA activating complex, subunit SNAP43-domain-containing protein [Pilobolus umbonatus]